MSDSSPTDNQPFDYLPDEWVRDFAELFRISTTAKDQPANHLIDSHFQAHYRNPAERHYRKVRILKAYAYLRRNLDSFILEMLPLYPVTTR